MKTINWLSLSLVLGLAGACVTPTQQANQKTHPTIARDDARALRENDHDSAPAASVEPDTKQAPPTAPEPRPIPVTPTAPSPR